MSVTLFGLTFHAYGVLIGVASLVAYELSGRIAKQKGISSKSWDSYVLSALIAGVVGARLYHGLTDWWMYAPAPWELLAVWRGGLSIIGGVTGGLVGLEIARRIQGQQHQLMVLLDCAVFGLPLAQVIGRIGNWLNQELYGLPTTLPWGVFIEPANRLPGYETYTHFHPLFLYEAMAMVLFGGYVWVQYATHQNRQMSYKTTRQIGTGWYFFRYLLYYSFVRFLLDFLRIIDSTQKINIGVFYLGFNQTVMLLVMTWMLSFILYRRYVKNIKKK